MIDENLQKKVEKYINDQYEKGHTLDVIEEELINNGYPKDFVKGLIKKHIRTYKHIPTLKSKGQIIFGIALVTVVLIFFFYLRSYIPKDCDNKECFLDKANACKSAKFTYNTGTLTYELITDPQCVLIKKVVGVADTEPEAVKTLLLNKEMQCEYEENNFDELYIISMLGGIQSCEGPLKSAFYEVVISVYNEEK